MAKRLLHRACIGPTLVLLVRERGVDKGNDFGW
jgi:hypothetical protein